MKNVQPSVLPSPRPYISQMLCLSKFKRYILSDKRNKFAHAETTHVKTIVMKKIHFYPLYYDWICYAIYRYSIKTTRDIYQH